MKDDFQWERTNYRDTFVHCSSADATQEQWRAQLVAFLQLLGRSPTFRITDNGYQRFAGVLVMGIDCTFHGHPFRISSDIPGEIILMHTELSRSLVEPLCKALKECWQRVPAKTA